MAPGMAREFHGQARSRILSDDELQKVWRAAEHRRDRFGALVRLLLLTGQRREKVASMKWSDLDGATWKIPSEEREKGNAGELVLPEAALAIIGLQPRVDGNRYVFAERAGSHLNGFSVYKSELDAASGVTAWRLHDLRRTARSLMSRAGVRPDIAERVLGHTIKGVEAVYDQHRYIEEKAAALSALARLVESIINPPAGNVTPIRKSA
jgi:integrase